MAHGKSLELASLKPSEPVALIKHEYLSRKQRRKLKLKGRGSNGWARKVKNG